MPWNENKGGGGGGPWGGGGSGSGGNGGSGGGSGGGGGDKSPWGRPPGKPGGSGGSGGGSGGGGDRPDLEESLRRMQDRFRRRSGGGNGRSGGGGTGRPGRGFGTTGVLIVVAVAFVGWLMTGVYTVNEQDKAVVLRFGKVHRTEDPGFHIRFPSPIEEQVIVPINRSQFIEIGANDAESLMLTRDGNIVHVDFAINWKVDSPEKYLFNVVDSIPTQQNELIRQVGESAMREAVGNFDFVPLITNQRGTIEKDVAKNMQDILTSYNAGVTIISISLKQAQPPQEVLSAQRGVTSAQQERERKRNEGAAYFNEVTNQAQGRAAAMRREAEGYRDATIAISTGEADRFTKVLEEYRRSPESRRVTRERMFLETMEEVLSKSQNIIVDTKNGTTPVLPIPADALRPRQPQ